MPNRAPMDDSLRKFAEARSHYDSNSAVEYTKLLIQLLVGGSGLAVTALLTLAGTLKDQPEFIRYVGFPCICYLAGIVFGALSAFDYARSQRSYAERWFLRSINEEDQSEIHQKLARKRSNKAKRWLAAGISSFVIGSLLGIIVLFVASLRR